MVRTIASSENGDSDDEGVAKLNDNAFRARPGILRLPTQQFHDAVGPASLPDSDTRSNGGGGGIFRLSADVFQKAQEQKPKKVRERKPTGTEPRKAKDPRENKNPKWGPRIVRDAETNRSVEQTSKTSPNAEREYEDKWLPAINEADKAMASAIRELQRSGCSKQDYDRVVKISNQLAALYLDAIKLDVLLTFRSNLEQRAWRGAFHRAIELLRTKTKSAENADLNRKYLDVLLDEGVEFFTCLLADYANLYDLGDDEDDGSEMESLAVTLDFGLAEQEEPDEKTIAARRSAARLWLFWSDLRRYRAGQNRESAELKEAAKGYRRAARLWPEFGHAYNQLAVVANLSKDHLTEAFWAMRAAAAEHSFEPAKERLTLLFQRHAELALQSTSPDGGSSRAASPDAILEETAQPPPPNEHWTFDDAVLEAVDAILMDERIGVDAVPKPGGKNHHEPVATDKLHLRITINALHAVGLLVNKIGMEAFSMAETRLVNNLAALLGRKDQKEGALPSLEQIDGESEHDDKKPTILIHIAALLHYAVETSRRRYGDDSAQFATAIDTLLTFGAKILSISVVPAVHAFPHRDALDTLLDVLPTFLVWMRFLHSVVEKRHRSADEPRVWRLLALLANRLRKTLSDVDEDDEGGEVATCITLPERRLWQCGGNGGSEDSATSKMMELYEAGRLVEFNVLVRLRVLLRELETIATAVEDGPLAQTNNGLFVVAIKEKNNGDGNDDGNDDGGGGGGTDDEPATRTQGHTEEKGTNVDRRTPIRKTIRPRHVVLDTNVILDALDDVQRLIKSGALSVLVPVAVLDELHRHGRPEDETTGGSAAAENGGERSEEHLAWRMAEAKRAEQCILSLGKDRTLRLGALAATGERLVPLRHHHEYRRGILADDRILSGCVAFAAQAPQESAGKVFSTVLLTNDRALMIRAKSEGLACCTLRELFARARAQSKKRQVLRKGVG